MCIAISCYFTGMHNNSVQEEERRHLSKSASAVCIVTATQSFSAAESPPAWMTLHWPLITLMLKLLPLVRSY